VFALTAQFPWDTDVEVVDAGVRWDSGVTSDFPMAATPAELLTARLRNQQLTDSRLRKPADVVSWLGAMQAQDYPAAKWAIGLRAPGCQDADVEQAFNDGLILRTHVLRPTWHFVAPADIRWMLALSAPRLQRVNAYYYRQAGLDAKTFLKSCAMIHRSLEGGNTLTRAEIAEHLGRARIPAHGLKLAYLVMQAELEGVICSGPRRGKQFTYALLEERAPKARPKDREASLAELAKRYFASHGPATVRDFSWWSGLTMKDAQQAIDSVRPTLESSSIGGSTVWSAHTPAKASKSVIAMLLPNYDEYLIAYKDRGAFVDESRAANIVARSGGAFANHLIIDGRLAGGWSRTIGGNSVKIEVAPYKKLTPAQHRAVANAADCYGEYLGLPATLAVV
jgi:Winged helix DNA-binding domain